MLQASGFNIIVSRETHDSKYYESISMEFKGQTDRFPLPLAKFHSQTGVQCLDRRSFQPGRRCGCPCPYFGRGVGMLHFGQHRIRDEDAPIKFREKFRMPEEDEVIERTGIGDNDHVRDYPFFAKSR